jgi:solute carrier family 35, member F5
MIGKIMTAANSLKVNSITSLISDICWAYAMLLTTPLVVTLGLSLTIPLSLVGQIVLQGQYASLVYWVGAAIVFLSFVLVNYESEDQDGRTALNSRSIGSSGSYQTVPQEETVADGAL